MSAPSSLPFSAADIAPPLARSNSVGGRWAFRSSLSGSFLTTSSRPPATLTSLRFVSAVCGLLLRRPWFLYRFAVKQSSQCWRRSSRPLLSPLLRRFRSCLPPSLRASATVGHALTPAVRSFLVPLRRGWACGAVTAPSGVIKRGCPPTPPLRPFLRGVAGGS